MDDGRWIYVLWAVLLCAGFLLVGLLNGWS